MCGINGFSWQDENLIKKMNSAIKHRGPDAENHIVLNNATLGQVRLSIIDLDERANQPLKYEHEGKEYWIVFNGEIYNYKEIRSELIKHGFNFNTSSDTEVLVAAYIFYGKDVVHKLNGMWAFCIYDGKKFFCSRDRVGKKPFYYVTSSQHFIFSSELKGLLQWLKNRTISKKAVELYFSLGFVPSPFTIFEEVKKLPPGSILEWNRGKEIKIEKFFRLPPYSPVKSKKEALENIDKTLREAVNLRWERSDVPVGIFLSSGIDSSLIYALLQSQSPKAFTIKFYDPRYDESDLVKKWTNPEIILYNKEDFQHLLDDYFVAYDEPFADYSSFAVMKLSKHASSQVKVVLSGDGGDEAFGGYEVYRAFKLSRLFKKCKCAYYLGLILQKMCKELGTCWKIGEILRLSKYSVKEWWK
ncbi:MAG: asparagine synthase (glutamine-hydrolyzing), partial [Candidatus Nanohaloarchaeota archaeon]|nr:asparagine synthase (glutamine-hydrolyzing) [Candidatus Nanohaloarchaeota archaeon]